MPALLPVIPWGRGVPSTTATETALGRGGRATPHGQGPQAGRYLAATEILDDVVFAGQDVEATSRAREYFAGYRPSSPSIGLLSDRKTVFMLERHQIEGRPAEEIARDLTSAFDDYCAVAA